MHLRHRELTERQHRHHRQQHHDQQRLDEIGSDHCPHATEQGVNGGDADHHHHAYVVIEAGERLKQQTGPHGLGHQKTEGVHSGDHHEHPPRQAPVTQPDEIATGAAMRHQLLDPHGQRREQDQAQTGQGITEHAPKTSPVAEFRSQQCGVSGHPGGHQRGRAQRQPDVASGQHVVVGISFTAAAPDDPQGDPQHGKQHNQGPGDARRQKRCGVSGHRPTPDHASADGPE